MPLGCLFLPPGTSLSARDIQGQAEIVGKRGGGGCRGHPPTCQPPSLPLPTLALCPVVLQGGDLDNIAGYGRNVRVGAWAGRGWPILPLWG